MNIWLLTTEYPPDYGGGIGTYAVHAATMLAQAGHRVTVLTLGHAVSIEQAANGTRIIRSAPPNVALSLAKRYMRRADANDAFPYNVMAYWPALSYQFAQVAQSIIAEDGEPPDIIECQDYGALAYYLLQRKLLGEPWLARTALLVHAHSPLFELERANQAPRYKFPNYWTGQMEKWCFMAADGVLSPSQFLADRLRETFGSELPISVLPLPYQRAAPVASQPTPGDVLYVGRLEVRKGVLELVRACAGMWASGANFRLAMVGGDTPYYPRGTTVHQFLRNTYAAQIAAGQLTILGDSLPPAALQQRVAQAWAVVVPSLWENFPYTCVEALAAGKVVIASTNGGQAEMISGNGDGFVFDWQRAGDFEQTLCRVLKLSAEENLAIGQRAAERIRSLTAYEAVLPQREAHYRHVMTRAHEARTHFPTLQRRPAPAMERSGGETAGRVSVVIPFYNRGAFIEETLNSALAADYADIEIIIVNDGSDEPASLEALRRIEAADHSNLRVVTTANHGAATARNIGATLATGEFLLFLDSDDLIAPDFIQRAVAVLQRYRNVGFVYSWVRFFDGNRNVWPTWNTEFPFLLGHNMLPIIAVVRRKLFLEHGRYRPEVAYNLEDYDSWLRIASSGALGVSIPDMLVQYRIHADSMFQGISEDQSLYLYDIIVQHHRELYREYGDELFQLLNANGPAYLWQHPALHYRRHVREFSSSIAAEEHMRSVALRRVLWSGWTRWRRLRARLRRLKRN